MQPTERDARARGDETGATRTVVVLGLIAVVLLAGVGWLVFGRSHHHPSPAAPPRAQPPAGASPANGKFSVVSYGADPGGHRDSTRAIRAAIQAAGQASSDGQAQTVYFPPGTYILNDNDGKYADFRLSHVKVNILGAGANDTKIVEEVGTYKYPSLKRGKTVFIFSDTNGFYFKGLTVDSQTYNAGDTLDNWGNDSVIEDSTFLGAHNGDGSPDGETNVFDVRDIAICHHNSAGVVQGYHTGNVVENVTLNGEGISGNADLDITCQSDVTLANIVDTGWGVALYSDKNATLRNYEYHPGARSSNYGYFVTSGLNITLADVVTYGPGGTIYGQGGKLVHPPNRPSRDVTIDDEQMRVAGYRLRIADAFGTTIENSTIDGITLSPSKSSEVEISGLTASNSSIGPVQCNNVDQIAGLTGIKCQTR